MYRHRSPNFSTYIIFIAAVTICITSAGNYLGKVIDLISSFMSLTCSHEFCSYCKFTSTPFIFALETITLPCCLVTDQIEAVLRTAVLTLLSVEGRRRPITSPCYRVTGGLTLFPISSAGWSIMIWRTYCTLHWCFKGYSKCLLKLNFRDM